ncbi:S8 family peptidase [Caldalkalibacillus salinus]|uniref:S8 family peptidase n=1 Tax=Caldalkalibacillus salinus TaxID=2803787 RepID=UPI0019227C48|nr:S8 family peptidase [Caldalkalibacillus salinus]
MKKFLSIALALSLCFMLVSPVVFATEAEQEEYLVQFTEEIEANVLNSFGVEDAEILYEFEHLPVVHVELTEKQAEGLKKNPQVKAVEIDAEVEATQTVPWGVPRVQGTDAQNAGYTGSGVQVAILDTGIDRSHEDLTVYDGYSVFTDSANRDPYYDGNGHGTHVAGTVAALNNHVGVLGVAPSAQLYAVKVLDNNGGGSYSGIARGIEWSINNNMDVINMSLGGSSSSSILKDWCDYAYNRGILLVAAAGNSGNSSGWGDTVGYPAKYDSVMAVAATDSNNNRASFSSHGPAVEISAPGVNILSTVPGNGYSSLNGTSMASPHVAGAAASVWQAKPWLSNAQLRQLLNNTAQYLGNSHLYGHGLVQTYDAIRR